MSRQFERLGDRVAEEAQLLAEEKWIIETIKKIKTQRNCLQIERLQLESLEARLKQKIAEQGQANAQPKIAQTCLVTSETGPLPSGTITTVGTRHDSSFATIPPVSQSPKPVDFDSCIDEELDLAVTKPKFSSEDFAENIMEEEEDDDDDMMIDMNMFMNADAKTG